MHDAAHGPNIALEADLSLLKCLRRHVVQGACFAAESFIVVVQDTTDAEVAYLHRAARQHEDIDGLQVTMVDLGHVSAMNSFEELKHHRDYKLLRNGLFFFSPCFELAGKIPN